MLRKTLGQPEYEAYTESVKNALASSPKAFPVYPIKIDYLVKTVTESAVSVPPSMADLEEVNASAKKVDFKVGEGDSEFVLKYKTSIVKYEDPNEPGKFVTMEVPVIDMTDVKGFVNLMIQVAELASMVREFGLSVLATHDAFTGSTQVPHTGPQLAEKLTGVENHSAFTGTQLLHSGKTMSEISEALEALEVEKSMSLIKNAVYYNATKSYIVALKEIKEALEKAPAAPVINVADSASEAAIVKTATPKVEQITTAEKKKPANPGDLIG